MSMARCTNLAFNVAFFLGTEDTPLIWCYLFKINTTAKITKLHYTKKKFCQSERFKQSALPRNILQHVLTAHTHWTDMQDAYETAMDDANDMDAVSLFSSTYRC